MFGVVAATAVVAFLVHPAKNSVMSSEVRLFEHYTVAGREIEKNSAEHAPGRSIIGAMPERVFYADKHIDRVVPLVFFGCAWHVNDCLCHFDVVVCDRQIPGNAARLPSFPFPFKVDGFVVVVIREHGGETLPGVFKSEGAALAWIKNRVERGTVLHADESPAWNDLHARFEMKRIDHQKAYSLDGACTNWAESYFARLRRGEMGHHHHISGPYLLRFAQEAAWREDNRRTSNGEQVRRVVDLALGRKPSVDFCGYWQRHKD